MPEEIIRDKLANIWAEVHALTKEIEERHELYEDLEKLSFSINYLEYKFVNYIKEKSPLLLA